MHKLRKGDRVLISKPTLLRKSDGSIEMLCGKTAVVAVANRRKCYCDIGLEKPVCIPITHLTKLEVAA